MVDRPYHHGNVRGAVLTHALALIAEEGADKLSVRGVARRAGVSHTAVGKEFGGLQGLLAACATQVHHRLGRALGEASADPSDPLTSFRRMGAAYVRFAAEHPAWMQLMAHPTVLAAEEPGLLTARRAPYDLLVGAIESCMQAGVIRRDAPTNVALHVWSAVHGFASLRSAGTLIPLQLDEASADELLSQLFLGLRPDEGQR
ncbi:MAG: TetR/AcrR family transcriptional regulator [Myxococcota bacterium]